MRLCRDCGLPHASDLAACPGCGWAPPLRNGFVAYAPDLDAAGTPGFKPEAFAELARLEEGHFWFQARNRIILWAMARHAPNPGRILEIGCGTGFVLQALARQFPQARVTGSEVFTTGLVHARQRLPGVLLCQMDARDIGHEAEFDVIGAFDVLEHIAEDERVLDQARKALVPGGVLVLTVPQHPWLWSPADDYACHERRYTARELTGKLQRAGFAIERSTSFVTLLLPAMMLSRLQKRREAAETRDPASEFRLPPLLNALFLAIMRVEFLLLRLGLSLPVGGSRLVVARAPRADATPKSGVSE
jgi:SAM-dependent methyltransferase